MKKTGVILVNWNGFQLTKDCIDSLKEGIVVPNYIVVIDNASHDNSTALLNQTFSSDIVIIQNTENLGFAEANNQGIELLLNMGVDYIWLLNNDTLVLPETLLKLINAYESCDKKEIAAVSAKIYYEGYRDKIWYAGAKRNRFSFGIIHDDYDITENVKTDFVSGCCIFASASIFKEYGGLQKDFIAYSEDSEWCLRLNAHGFKFLVVRDSVIYHKVSASLKKNTGTYNKISDRALYLMNRNHLWVIRKYAPHKWFSMFSMLIIGVKNMIFELPDIKRCKVIIKSYAHGLFKPINF